MFLPFLNQSAGGVDPNVYLGATRIAGIANVGYSMTGSQRQLLNPLFRYLRGQGLASNLLFHHDPKVGLNNNLNFFTDDITTANVGWAKGSNLTVNGQVGVSPITGAKAWSFTSLGGGNVFIQGSSTTGRFAVLPNTTYTLSADVRLTAGTWGSGSRSLYLRCQDSGGAVTSARGNTALALTSEWQRFSITVTTGALDVFASFLFPFDFNAGSTIEVAAPQIELGSVATSYQRRLDNTTLKLNNTVNNALGDGTFVNGEMGNMATTDATAGEVLNFVGSSTQFIDTTFTEMYANYTFSCWVNPANFAASQILLGKAINNDRVFYNTTGGVQVSSNGGTVTTASSLLSIGVWAHVAYTITLAGAVVIYINGVSVASGTITRGADAVATWGLSKVAPMTGKMGEATLINTVLTSTQILAIYNIQKSRYGL